MNAVELAINSIDPKNGTGNLLTSFTFGAFISEDREMMIPECCIIVGVEIYHQAQTFFCLLDSEDEDDSGFHQKDVELIITTIDGIKIEMTCCGKIKLDGVSFATFTPFNSQKPDINLKFEGSILSFSTPQEIINAKWEKLKVTSIANLQILFGDEFFMFIPNPDFTDFPPQNLFIDHLKCIDAVLKLY